MEIKTNTQFKIFTSEKVIVFSKQKVATRYLYNRFYYTPIGIGDKDESQSFTITDDLSLINGDDLIVGYGDTKIMYSEIFDIHTNKKDIILIYRNPLDRFVTGVLQYTLKSLNTKNFSIAFDTEPVYKTKFDILFKLSQEYLFGNVSGFVNEHKLVKEKMSPELFDIAMKEVVSFSELIIHRICTFLKYVTIPEDSHTENYLWCYNSIINDSRIDNNKLLLVNLTDSENSLSSILDSYLPNYESHENFRGTREQTSNSSGQAKSMLLDYIKKDKELYTKVKDYIKIDEYFYNLFEKSNLNILNKSK